MTTKKPRKPRHPGNWRYEDAVRDQLLVLMSDDMVVIDTLGTPSLKAAECRRLSMYFARAAAYLESRHGK
jgi:hypothetical protein